MRKQKIILDDVLDQFSMFGRYHLQFMGLAFIMYMYGTTFSHSYIFAAEENSYVCMEEAFANNTCGIVNGEGCSQWRYEIPSGFVAEYQIACQEWKRTLVGTIHCFGYMIGLLLMGPLSDRLGRKNVFLITSVSGAVFGLAKSFSPSYWLYVALEFLGAAFGDNYLSFYVLNLEIVSAKKRVIFIGLCHIGTSFGGVSLAFAAWIVPYWRNVVLVIYVPAFFFLTYYYFMDESPRWMLSKGKKHKAKAILKKMADTNNMQLAKDYLDNLETEIEQNTNFYTVIRMTIRSRTLLKRFFVCVVWWTTITFVFHGMMINSVALQGNKYINYGLVQLVHLAGDFMAMFILENYKRKYPMVCSFFVAALLCFLQIFLPDGFPWLSVTVYLCASLMSSVLMSTVYIFTSELFPTYTRNSMHALCSSLGRIGAMLAPQTPLLRAYWSGLPTLVFGLASLVAGLTALLVPDTADHALPNTVREAERLGKTAEKHTDDRHVGVDNLGMTTF